MSELPKIDIVIPAYNCHNTILRPLGSIVSQSIKDDLNIIIVNDKSEKDYSEFVDMFSPYISIKEVKLEENVGPGLARQEGINNSTSPLITFIDADDSFSGAFALKQLRLNMLLEQQNVAVFSNFLEENQENVYIQHPNDTVWMFGKLYKRDFLKKYDIHFNSTRANEDNGFNMMVQLCSNQNEQIKFIGDITYYWHSRPDSITRRDNCNYSYNDSFVGYVDNMIYAIKHAEKKQPFNGNIMFKKVTILCNLYQYYIETCAKDPRYIEQNMNSCKKYYKEIYQEIENKIEDNILSESYGMVMGSTGNKFTNGGGFIPVIGFREWLEALKN